LYGMSSFAADLADFPRVIVTKLLIPYRRCSYASGFRTFGRSAMRMSYRFIAGAGSDEARAVSPVPGAKESVLPSCAIYGANASGKSNVLKALNFVRHAVLQSHRRWEPGGPVPVPVFRADSASREAEFELDFIAGATRYRFGFKATGTEIVTEWLFSYPNGRRQEWYSR